MNLQSTWSLGRPFRTKGSHHFHSRRLIPVLLFPGGSPPSPSLCRPNVSRHPPQATSQPLSLTRARLAWGKVGGHLRARLLPLLLLFFLPRVPRPPPPARKSPGSVNPIEWSGAAHSGSPLAQPAPFLLPGAREPSSARAAALPGSWRWGTVCAGQPGALAAIQGGERRGKRRTGEGRGGEPRAQEQRRAPHRTAPRTLAGS